MHFTALISIVALASSAAAAPNAYNEYSSYNSYNPDNSYDHSAPSYTLSYEPTYTPTYSAPSSYRTELSYDDSGKTYNSYTPSYNSQYPVTAPNDFWNILYFHATVTIPEPYYPDPKKGFSVKLTSSTSSSSANEAFNECLKINLGKPQDEKANFLGVFYDEIYGAWFCQATIDGKTVVTDATESTNPIKGYKGNKIRESAGFVLRVAPKKPDPKA